MEYLLDMMKPEDWEQVRLIYLEDIGTAILPLKQMLPIGRTGI
jgi:hypothetical protein